MTIINLFGSGVTVAEPPEPRLMHCDACGTATRHELSADGHWICYCGMDATAHAEADERVMLLVESVARMFRVMMPERREKWFAILVDCLGAELSGELLDAIGRSKL